MKILFLLIFLLGISCCKILYMEKDDLKDVKIEKVIRIDTLDNNILRVYYR